MLLPTQGQVASLEHQVFVHTASSVQLFREQDPICPQWDYRHAGPTFEVSWLQVFFGQQLFRRQASRSQFLQSGDKGQCAVSRGAPGSATRVGQVEGLQVGGHMVCQSEV